MATNPNKAGIAGALDKIASGLASGMQNREQAQLEKQTATLKMKQQQSSDDTGAWQAQMDEATAASKKAAGEIQREKTFRSLKAYSADGNVRHLNGTVLDEARPSGIVRFNKISPSIDSALIAQAGLDPEDIFNTGIYDDGTGAQDSKQYVKATMQDGTEKILSTYEFKKAVGYFKNLTDEEVAQELAANEAKAKTGGKQYSPGAMEKDARFISGTTGDDLKNVTTKLYNDRTQGNTAGQEDVAIQNRQLLDEKYGGSFVKNFDPNDPDQKAEAYQYVRNIERFGKVEIPADGRKDLKNIGKLISLGDPSSQLKEEETGLVDNFMFGLKKYWSDEGGSESAASFAAFRNVIRHTLYGSALTDSEIQAFDAQLGTPNKKLGPLLKETATALREVKGQMDMLAALEDPYVVKYRMGVSMDQLEDIQDSLNKTITYLERKSQGKVAVDPNATPQERVKSYEDMI